MAHLLYVTPEVLHTLKRHPAYRFWRPLVENSPIRQIPLDERAFHPRDVKLEEGGIYLTVDMKFVYCRDNLVSFLYADQDLSFRLSASRGILRTTDNNQFTALLGRVAIATGTSSVDLVNTDRVYHEYFDDVAVDGAPAGIAVPAPQAAPAPAAPVPPPVPAAVPPAPAGGNGDGQLVLGRYTRTLCDEMVAFRNSSKKSYGYLAEKYGLPKDDVKAICKHYQQAEKAKPNPVSAAAAKVAPKIRKEIVRMKKVSKKSYRYLSERFDLPEETVREVCAQELKRPRKVAG